MLESKRLILRQFTLDDLNILFKHRSDETIMQYLGGTQTAEMVESKIKIYSEFYEENGYAFCAMIWKETYEFIGVGGMQTSLKSGDTEVGYTVEKKFWRKGIATECTIACLNHGFNKIGLKRITALTHKNNIGSIRVLEKAGMTFAKETENMGETWVVYAIKKEEYVAN